MSLVGGIVWGATTTTTTIPQATPTATTTTTTTTLTPREPVEILRGPGGDVFVHERVTKDGMRCQILIDKAGHSQWCDTTTTDPTSAVFPTR